MLGKRARDRVSISSWLLVWFGLPFETRGSLRQRSLSHTAQSHC